MMFKYFILILLLFASVIYSQNFDRSLDKNAQKDYEPETIYKTLPMNFIIEQLINEVNKDSIHAILQYMDQMGVKNAGSSTLDKVRDWIKEKLIAYGYDVEIQDVGSQGSNLIIEKKGTKFPNTKVIIGGHYDSVRQGPGVNDNGSGTATLLEIARILRNREAAFSLIIIWFTAEEIGLVGSKEYVKKIGSSMDLKVMFNIDMIGGVANKDMTHVTCEEDRGGSSSNNAASKIYTDTLVMLTNTYTKIETKLDRAYGSDYMSFESKGYTITGYYEYVPGGNPYYHKATDLLKNMDVDYVFELTKGALAFAITVAQVDEVTIMSANKNNFDKDNFTIANPGLIYLPHALSLQYNLKSQGLWSLNIFDLTGKLIISSGPELKKAGKHTLLLDKKKIASQIYYIQPVFNGKKQNMKKFWILK